MTKFSYAPQADRNDKKIFRETLGSFGTTTAPGEDQLKQLQSKVRQGVKHVELHLGNQGKGEFNRQDVPDKYGFEQRRTIMQLAKLNKQTLSVHGTFNINSFAGISRSGLSDWERWKSIKEIDETLKFAAETAKQGAVVFHLHETNLPTPAGELNLPKHYLEWLKNNKDPKLRAEYERIKEDYLVQNPLKRKFVDDPTRRANARVEYQTMDPLKRKRFEESYASEIVEAKKKGEEAWDVFYQKERMNQMKLSPELSPLVLMGGKIEQVQRDRETLNVAALTGKFTEDDDSYDRAKALTDKERNKLMELGVDVEKLTLQDYQKAMAIFTNDIPREARDKITREEFTTLKKKLLLRYDDILSENEYMQSEADAKMFKKQIQENLTLLGLQKKNLEVKYEMYKDDLNRIKILEKENRDSLSAIEKLGTDDVDKAAREVIKLDIAKRNEEIQKLQYQGIGISEYQELARYDEAIAQLNRQKKEFEEKKEGIKSLTEEVFTRNASAMGDLGLRALKYQLDLKKSSKESPKLVAEYRVKIKELEEKRAKSSKQDDYDKLTNEINKLKYEQRLHVGRSDYDDIDVENKPLYLAPENIMAGYGYMDSLEEYKGVIRESWNQFAHKLLSDDPSYKDIRDAYEKETGKKVTSFDDAVKIAKHHIGGTFDNAHAGVWLKFFRKKEGESEETRLREFNKWLNTEAEKMYEEGIIKHVHFNDTQGKDDDHNLLGSGLLDIHDLRERLRKKGFNEAWIVEAGGRGANEVMHLMNAFDIFNPLVSRYKADTQSGETSSVSDWLNVKRTYQNRPQYSFYGLGYSAFRPQQSQNGNHRGDWSGMNFL
ncbi:MAG: hypothetical protein KC548_02165 [Nanoarchaeota archaeon]|nr:hypothetical protein [Nanoarchaeota archaeon]